MKIKSIQHLVSETLNPKRKKHIKYKIRKLQSSEIKEIQSITGIDVQGYSYSLDDNGVLHTLKEHGNAKKEEKRGQIAVTTDKFNQIRKILNEPDKIE